MGKNFRSTVIGIAQILHCETDTAGFVLLFKEFYCMILAVIFLRYFHDIHQTSGLMTCDDIDKIFGDQAGSK